MIRNHKIQNPDDFFESSVKSAIAAVLVLYLFFPVAAKADWESDANARIEQIRKRDVQITVVDLDGYPVSNLNVQIDQIYHRFAFGTCIAYWPLNNYSNYRNFILDHFEWAVCENEMKWSSNESTRDVETYSQADYIANWCADNGIILRGHCVVWETGSQTPSWVSGLSCATYPTISEMLQDVDERIDSIVDRYKGQIVQWDINNEMLSGNMFDCLGEAGRAHFFDLANSIDPNCGMYMNEYSGNSFTTNFDGDAYRNRAQGLITLGAPIEGLGIQAHINSPFDGTSAVNYYNNLLNELDDLGLPMIVTEFDSPTQDDNQRANDLENFYRICFSHPNVEGIIMWGFWEGHTWRPDNLGYWGLVESDWSINAAGVRYETLLDEWTTEDSNYTDLSGNVNFRGFHGTYEITLSVPGEPAEIYIIELEPGETTAEFLLETNLESPEPDFTPPEPDPMTWASMPTAIGSSTITMTATTATDERPPVEYYFECINDGDANSNWQTDETYVAQGLEPSTLYTFRVKARDSDAAHNETGWSTEESATTEPPGNDVEIIGDWVEGLTHIEEAGFDRVLIFIAHWEDNVAPSLTVTYGGQTMTRVVDATAGESGYRNYVAAFILDEPNIAAANGDTFNPAWVDTPGSVSYASLFLQNVNQTTPIGDFNSNNSVTSTPNPIATDPLSTEDGDMVIVGAVCGNNGSYTLNNGFTEGTDQSIGIYGHTGVTGHKSATGVAETPGATFDADVNRQAIIGFVVQAAVPVCQNCSEVQAAGYSLLSDLDGDCYVDYRDLEIIAYYWLDTACDECENCEGADFEPTDGAVDFFDYSDFASGWLQCNDPQDPACLHNW